MKIDEELEKAYAAFDSGNYEQARGIFEQLEVQQTGRAHLYLGWMYEQGLGGTINPAKAEYHFRCLADAGDSDGKYYLAGNLLRKGEFHSAVLLYEELAELGHVSAAYWAYALYSKELASESDAQQKAQRLLIKASDLGHMFARRDLARQECATGKNLWRRFLARVRYQKLKLAGFLLIMRDSEDLRVR